ncbi:hypothetical protein [Dysgonomonas massiliensis]|uniref:hypothetical protein n=1 Tax=Dysgonomonas massiliensis TaxID=2040292 RepID=UPI000C76FA4C|nr:hypothetical protein [Dysgonomonas massiliensis]
MKQTLTFNPSIIQSTESKINLDAFDKSVDAYEKKDYKQSFLLLLDYINPDIRTKYQKDNSFSVPHGSVLVNIELTDDQLIVTAPFLKLPDKNRVPLLRQTATLNFRYIDMAHIKLENERLLFEYSCPLALANPYKLYYVLREICATGDEYDDEFATKFGAERIYEPKITPYDAKTLDAVYSVIQQSCEECNTGIKYFESERKYGYAWNIVASTLLKILYYAHPQGQLLNDINKAIEDLDREDIPLSETVNIARKLVDRIQAMSKEELSKDMYYVETFVSTKRRSTLTNIQDNFKGLYETVSKYMEQEDYMASTVMMTYQFYNMYYNNDVQDDVNKLVVNALTQSSAKPWSEAASIQFRAVKSIMEGNLSTPIGGGSLKDAVSSLFGGLFGKKK